MPAVHLTMTIVGILTADPTFDRSGYRVTLRLLPDGQGHRQVMEGSAENHLVVSFCRHLRQGHRVSIQFRSDGEVVSVNHADAKSNAAA